MYSPIVGKTFFLELFYLATICNSFVIYLGAFFPLFYKNFNYWQQINILLLILSKTGVVETYYIYRTIPF